MKELKDYLHLYLGCELDIKGTSPDYRWLLSAVQSDCSLIYARNNHDSRSANPFYITQVKPILRPLSDISQEEFYILVKEKFHYDQYIKTRVENQSTTEPAAIYFIGVKIINLIEIETQCTQHMSNLNPTQFLYLLSIGVDLFGLIESGLAIDATTLYKKDITIKAE